MNRRFSEMQRDKPNPRTRQTRMERNMSDWNLKTLLKRMLLIAGMLSALIALTGAAAAQDAIERIMKTKQLRIGYIPSPPSAIKDPATGKLSGFYVDAVRLVAEQMNVEPVFVETTWATFPIGLATDQFDVSIAGTFATVGRATAVDFTRPLQYLGYSAVVKASDTRFKTLADMDQPGIKIALVQGAAGHEFAKEYFKKAELVVLSTSNLTAPFIEVTAGRADVGIEDAWSVRRYAKEHPEVKDLFRDNPYNLLPIAWAVKRGNTAMLNFMNTAIGYLISTGRMERMAEAYGPTGRFKEAIPLEVFGASQ
jgi:ABC-type amino acid transport substrate-binding protein